MADWKTTKLESSAETVDAGKIYCYDCSKKTQHDILASVQEQNETTEGDAIVDGTPIEIEMWSSTDFEIIRCRGCERIAFRMRSRFSEDTDLSPILDAYGGTDYIDVPVERVNIYPRSGGSIGFLDGRFLPAKVQTIYRETCSAIVYDNRILAGIGLRAILETICRDKGASGRNLEKKIDDLVTKGFLSVKAAEILHKIRFLGNRAAHEVTAETAENVGVALKIIENLMEQTYILPNKAAAF